MYRATEREYCDAPVFPAMEFEHGKGSTVAHIGKRQVLSKFGPGLRTC